MSSNKGSLNTRTRAVAVFALFALLAAAVFASPLARLASAEERRATVFTDKADYVPGEIVTINGAGWEPGETVTLVIHEELVPQVRPDLTFTATAGPDGTILNTQFSPEEHHRGVLFLLTATGGSSGRSAATAFTDENSSPGCGVSVSGPANNTKSVGDTINLLGQVTNPGTGALTYQWYQGQGNQFPSNYTAIPSATGINHSFTATANDDNTRYVLVARNTGTGALCTGTHPTNNPTIFGNASTPFTLRIIVPTAATTSLAVSAASGSYGSTVTLSATLTASGTGVSSKTVSFTVNGAAAGSGTTNASGVASTSYALPQALNVGSYTIGASFAGDTTHLASNGSGTLSVVQANATVQVTGGSFPYDGQPHPASGSVTGVFGESLGTPTFSYAPGGASVPVNAGTYAVTGSYAGSTNYAAGSNNLESITITKAETTTTVMCGAGPFTYDGSPQTPCSASVTGPGGLNQTLTVGYQNNTNAGTATASASYAETANYQASSDSENFTIGKAASTTVVTCGAGPFTYNGAAQTPCSVSVTGAGGLNLTPTPDYANNVNAGTATASYTYAGDNNHEGSSDSETFEIGKAASVTAVTCGAGPFSFTGSAITPCSVSVTGAGGLNLTPNPVYSDNVNAGTATASYNFAGDDNHEASSDSENFTIDKAATTTVVTCGAGPFTYNGAAQTPCTAKVTGPGGLDETLTVGYQNNTNAGTATASASYAETANYLGSNDSKNFTIGRANATINVTGYTGYYDSQEHGATGTATGVNGEDLSSLLNLGSTFQNVPGGTANWTFNSSNTNGNYNTANGSVAITINAWNLRGFYQPVEMSLGSTPVWNTIKGGSTVPLKFNIFVGTTEKTTTSAVKGFAVNSVPCTSGLDDPVDPAFTTTGGTTLRYDLTAGQFVQNWQTPKGAGQCLRVTMMAQDGTAIIAHFKTK